MKYKLWVRRMSISAPKMTVKSQISWPLKAFFLFFVVIIGGVLALWVYDLGRNFAGNSAIVDKQQLASLHQQIKTLTLEKEQFQTVMNGAESRFNIERAMREQFGQQIRILETENAKLKEDLGFFKGLLPNAIGKQGIIIQRLTAELLAPTQLHYQMLIMQGGKRASFSGNLQLLVSVTIAGKNTVLSFPGAANTDKAAYQLDFKYYQRVEGELTLPEGAVVSAIQAKVLEKGQVRAQLMTNL